MFAGDRFANGLSVRSIILVSLDVGLHVGRRHQAHRMTKSLQFARPMMRRGAGFDTNEARRQLLKEWQNVPALKPAANDYITCSVNSVDLKNRLGDVETDCRDRLHVWLLRIVGALTAPTSMALPCRWRSRPQHQKPTCDREQSQSRAINVGAWSLLWNKSPLHTVYKRRRTATARHGPSACRYCRNDGQP